VIELIGVESVNERALYVTELPSLDEWPERIEEPVPHFVAFVAADAASVDDEALHAFARKLAAQGAVYVCAWGPGCERLHDAIDAVAPAGVVTTWHADDTLDEALWFALFASSPHASWVETTDSVLAIVVGDPRWAAQVRGRLGNPDGLRTSLADR
jgi:hypothetical protein